MSDFQLNNMTIGHIAGLESPHMTALNWEIYEAYPVHRDRAYATAMGFNLATLLDALEDPAEKRNVIRIISVLLHPMGYELTSVV